MELPICRLFSHGPSVLCRMATSWSTNYVVVHITGILTIASTNYYTSSYMHTTTVDELIVCCSFYCACDNTFDVDIYNTMQSHDTCIAKQATYL